MTDPGPTDRRTEQREAEARVRALNQSQAETQGSDDDTAVPSNAKAWGLLLSIVLIAAAWYHTFQEMWLRWFPAWERTTLTFTERLTEGDSYYTHGPLVPLTSLVICWFIYKRVGLPTGRSRGASMLGWLMLAVFLGFHLLSVSPGARVMFVSGFSLIGVIGGLILVWGGWPLARAYWLPVTFLFFMVPMPEVAITDLNFKLKFIAGNAAIWLTNNVFGVPAVMDGSYIYLTPDAVTGEAKTLVIDSVCSGLRSLISLVWFASLFAMVCRAKGVWRVMMLALAVPVAILCNMIRITTLNVSAHYGSIEIAGPGGWVHDLSGLLVFAIALGVLFTIEQAVVMLGNLLKRDWSEIKLMAYLDRIVKVPARRPAFAHPATLAVLVVTAGLSLWWTTQSFEHERGTIAVEWVPKTLNIDGVTFTSEDLELDELTLIILETPEYLLRRYIGPNQRRYVDLLIVFSANNRKGTHPPDVCIEGGGNQIIAKDFQTVDVDQVGPVRLRELVSQRGTSLSYFLYTYKSGGHYTPSFFSQQFWIFMNGLTMQNTGGALIRFSAYTRTRDIEHAKKLTLAAAEALLPEVDKGVP